MCCLKNSMSSSEISESPWSSAPGIGMVGRSKAFSFPFDFMHLIWENVLKNLVLLWTGGYKGLDSGTEDYVFDPETWKVIGEATAASGATIPSVYGPRPPDINTDKTSCTADSWSFWALYIAPVVLRGRFCHEKYYNHFMSLLWDWDNTLVFRRTL